MDELVSCILPTGNRNRFFAQALRCFTAQTYPHRELIVIDDGEVPVRRLCQGIPNVRYIRLDRHTLLGTKLNIGIENASGSMIQKLDDDDYYAPAFLETAVARMRRNRRTDSIVGWECFLLLLAGSSQLYFSGHGWLAGGTLSFRRSVWEKAPFRDVPKNEDFHFLEDHGGPRLRVRLPEQYVLVRHGANTWKTFWNRVRVDSYVRSLEPYGKAIGDVVADDASARFYARLRQWR